MVSNDEACMKLYEMWREAEEQLIPQLQVEYPTIDFSVVLSLIRTGQSACLAGALTNRPPVQRSSMSAVTCLESANFDNPPRQLKCDMERSKREASCYMTS